MSIGTKIYTWIYGNYVGSDELENKYYCNSKDFNNIKYKRWVIFKGEIEASKIPPHWHAWLHKSIDKAPINYSHEYDWQKNHQPNHTGTSKAYYPNSHPLSNSSKKTDDSDYEKWQP